MRAIAFTPLVATLAVTAALAQPTFGEPGACVPRDHYDPFVLAEFARERTREGDLGTARIMLARAARISPYQAPFVITPAPGKPAAAARLAPASAAPVPPAPPPIWPAKPPAP